MPVPRNSYILVTGGAGYVGSALVPRLLEEGYGVKVLDLYLYGKQVFEGLRPHPNLVEIQGDLRNPETVKQALVGCDAVIHLACISNDPSFELNPDLGKSINFDAFEPLVQLSKDFGIQRFVYASSSSVYGVKQEPEVTEDLSLEPLTDYSKYKAMCEEILLKHQAPGFETLVLRPATVCGYSPRLRLDLTVNILTNHAYHHRKLKVFGGSQLRPNIHIADMVEIYLKSLQWETEKIDGKIFNAGYENHSVADLATIVQEVVGSDVERETLPTDDLRSYQVSSAKLQRELGFTPSHTIHEAVEDLVAAFQAGKVANPMEDPHYYNIRMMQSVKLT